MGFGIKLKKLREYYTHKEVDQRIRDAEVSLERSKVNAAKVRKTIIAPSNYFSQENSFKNIIVNSLRLGHSGGG